MSNAGMGLFVLFGLIAVLSALATVTMHSPIRAAMALLAHIVALSGLFLLLHAHVLAALQVLVYAGAVVVLFVFVIMMIGPEAPEPPVLRGMLVKTVSATVMLLLTALLAFSLLPVTAPHVALAPCLAGEGAECAQFGGVVAFSQSLFAGQYVPFELISVLLTVAIVGAIAVARGRTAAETKVLAGKLKDREEERAGQLVPVAVREPQPEAATATAATVVTRITVEGGH
ncbi:MAG: NADH-quinone oxidoreductase subunit J [Polyangiales bacterium]